jgi:hypothetical protein
LLILCEQGKTRHSSVCRAGSNRRIECTCSSLLENLLLLLAPTRHTNQLYFRLGGFCMQQPSSSAEGYQAQQQERSQWRACQLHA